MGTIKNAVYKVDNGTDFDEIHFKTKASQVFCSDGKTVESQLAEITQLIPNIAHKVTLRYRPETSATDLGMTVSLGEKGIYLYTATVLGGGGDPNHSITGTWIIKWLGGGTLKIQTCELIGTISKIGYAQSLQLNNPNDVGQVYLAFKQTNPIRAQFLVQILKLGEGV